MIIWSQVDESMSPTRTAIAISALIALTAIALPTIGGIRPQANVGVSGKPLAQQVTTTTVSCTLSSGQEFSCNAVIMNDEVTGGFSSGSVTWTTSGTGSFSPSSVCTLTEDSASTSHCVVYYVPSATDTRVTITASYSGDPENQPSTGTVTFNAAQETTSSSSATTSSQSTSTLTSSSLSTITSTSSSVDTTISSTTSTVTPSSTSDFALYAGVIVAIVAVVLIIVFLLMRGRMGK